MPYPVGVTLVPVRSGPVIVMESGLDGVVKMTAIASRGDLVWDIGGIRLPSKTWTTTSEPGEVAELMLPATDQDNWLAGGVSLDPPTHTYQITLDLFHQGIGHKLYRSTRLVYTGVEVPAASPFIDVDTLSYA